MKISRTKSLWRRSAKLREQARERSERIYRTASTRFARMRGRRGDLVLQYEASKVARALRKVAAAKALAALDAPRSLPAGLLDESCLFFCAVLTTLPEFLEPRERAQCEALIALREASSAWEPDWLGVASLAERLYARSAKAHGARAGAHFKDRDAFGSCPRVGSIMPSYEMNRGAMSLIGEDLRVDGRREKRRAGRQVPAAWLALSGGEALWRAGVSGNFLRQARAGALFPGNWAQSVLSLRDALLAQGARAVFRVPGFYARHPDLMGEEGRAPLLALLDSEAFPSRQLWALDRAMGAGSSGKVAARL